MGNSNRLAASSRFHVKNTFKPRIFCAPKIVWNIDEEFCNPQSIRIRARFDTFAKRRRPPTCCGFQFTSESVRSPHHFVIRLSDCYRWYTVISPTCRRRFFRIHAQAGVTRGVTLGGTRWVVLVFTIQLRCDVLARDHRRRLADNMYWLPVDMRKTYRKLRDVRCIEKYRIRVQQQQQQQLGYATDHVSNILASCKSLLYALRIPLSHGIPETSLHDVCARPSSRSCLLPTIVVWCSLCSATLVRDGLCQRVAS